MSEEETNNTAAEHNEGLGRKKIQQILASVGSRKTDDSEKIEAEEYNWRKPNYFGRYQLRKLDKFTKKIALECGERFAQLYNSDFNVTITSTEQLFADEYISSDYAQNDYFISFCSDEEQTFGLVGLPKKTAVILATQLLGEEKSSEESEENLSKLEESLLLDVADAIVKAFSDSCDGCDLYTDRNVVRGHLPIDLEGTEEFCRIVFTVEKVGSENTFEAYFVIPSENLDFASRKGSQFEKKISDEEVSRAMLKHVHNIRVNVLARLGSTVLSFEEIMSLQPDDILLFDKSIDEPVDLIVEDKTIIRGRPSKSGGKYAVVITESCCPITT